MVGGLVFDFRLFGFFVSMFLRFFLMRVTGMERNRRFTSGRKLGEGGICYSGTRERTEETKGSHPILLTKQCFFHIKVYRK